jgi:hypothetical protein
VLLRRGPSRTDNLSTLCENEGIEPVEFVPCLLLLGGRSSHNRVSLQNAFLTEATTRRGHGMSVMRCVTTLALKLISASHKASRVASNQGEHGPAAADATPVQKPKERRRLTSA